MWFYCNVCILKWFTFYLLDKFQRVALDGYCSDWLPVRSGVPQGFILGPVKFLVYINDLLVGNKNNNIRLFADDTKFYIDVSIVYTCQKVQNDINALHQ